MLESQFGPRNPEVSATIVSVGDKVAFIDRDAELSRFGCRGVAAPSEFRSSMPDAETPQHSSEGSTTGLPQAAIVFGGLTSLLEARH